MPHYYQILTVTREVRGEQLTDGELLLYLHKRARLQPRCIVCTKKPTTTLAIINQAQGESVVTHFPLCESQACRDRIGEQKPGYLTFLSQSLSISAQVPTSSAVVVVDKYTNLVSNVRPPMVNAATQTDASKKQKRKHAKRNKLVPFIQQLTRLPMGAWADLTDEEFPE